MRYRAIPLVVSVLFAVLASSVSVSSTPATLTEEQQIAHALNRIAYGPRPGDVERVRKMGLRDYIEQQLKPDSINDSAANGRVQHLTSIAMSQEEIFERYPDPQRLTQQLGIRNPNQGDNVQANRAKLQEYMTANMLQRPQQLLQELVAHKVLRAVYSERQLQEVMTDFWYNHFNVHWDKGADRWLTTDYEMTAIRPHVLGKFKDLVLATAKSPAMLFYLDNHLSSVPSPQAQAALRRAAPNLRRQQGINENYARELMELHTLGVDGGYTQKDVTEVARAFTGWTIDRPRVSANFIFRPQMHDRGEKVVLGKRIRANGGMEDGEQVIDILVNHPSTAQFIATKLVRRFVSDDPPESLVTRVAATYRKTDGDIREMLRTIFFSEEFMSPEAFAQKTKTPFEYVVSSIRALGGDTFANNQQLPRAIAQMGQPLYQYQAPTGFPDRADYWTSDGAIVARLNFAVALTSNRIPDTRISLNGFKDAQAAALFVGSPDFQKR
jgi:uncharacterized protein (DUF1800 family)